jgi:CxxC-x17-CxxC domain-containing protein
MYTDRELTCRDCGQTFVFTTGEQEFFASRGFQNDPSRCTSCRAARNTGGASAGGFSGGGYSSGGGYERAERQMFPATCSDCGKATQVPFQPRSDRPVYCSDCFEQHRPARTESRGPARW